MTEQEVLALVQQGEDSPRAFLPARTRTPTLGETMVAMANSHGGTILLGVRGQPRPRVEGIPAPEEARALIQEVAQECVPPLNLPSPEPVSLQGSTILVITVPSNLPHAYHWRGLYLHRVDGKNALLSGAELRTLLLDRGEEKFEALVPAGATVEDLDMERVARYAGLLLKAPADPLELLRRRGCLAATPAGPAPTCAGLLLFGKDPQAFLPQAQITIVRHPGTSPGHDPLRQEVRGTLPEQIRQAEEFLRTNMRRGRVRVDANLVEVTEYPIEVVREALVNAVAHRDYSVRGDEIRVSMFLDRIEVYSPGRLPGPVTVENLLQERFSRNPAIVQLLVDLKLIERLGYGLDSLVALMAEAHLPPPSFRETRGGFLLTLPGPRGMAMEEIPTDPQALARLGLNDRQVRALLSVGDKGRISGREFQELCPEVSPETLRRDLADLVSRGLLLKVGEKRATYYILK